jgi:hypothetical protein
MNPNQMMIAKAMVSQKALRDEARRSRTDRLSARRKQTAREERTGAKGHGIFAVLGLALPGRR